jgi:hypothetical protein
VIKGIYNPDSLLVDKLLALVLLPIGIGSDKKLTLTKMFAYGNIAVKVKYTVGTGILLPKEDRVASINQIYIHKTAVIRRKICYGTAQIGGKPYCISYKAVLFICVDIELLLHCGFTIFIKKVRYCCLKRE